MSGLAEGIDLHFDAYNTRVNNQEEVVRDIFARSRMTLPRKYLSPARCRCSDLVSWRSAWDVADAKSPDHDCPTELEKARLLAGFFLAAQKPRMVTRPRV